jgi:thioesterase domain-containing protein
MIVPLNAASEDYRNPNAAFYCVHPISGTVDSYFRLAESFDPLPFFGLKAPLELMAGDWSIREIADCYADALVVFQPEGSFFLGGWSAGGTIAQEIAVNLRKRGRTVDVLAIIDARFDGSDAEVRLSKLHFALRVARGLPGWIRHERETNKKLRHAIAKGIVQKVSRVRGPAEGAASIEDELMIDISSFPERRKKFVHMLSKALRNHIPESLCVEHAVVYEAEVLPIFQPSPVARAWCQFLSDFDVVRVGGRHLTMMQPPHLQTIAGDLKRRIVEARRERANSNGEISGQLT